MSVSEIILLVIAVVLVLVLVLLLIIFIVTKKKKQKKDKETNTSKPTEASIKISYLESDFVLSRGKTFAIGLEKDLKPGKYVLLSTDNNSHAFNLRFGGLVREYHHEDEIVLTNGDEITAVSHTVILR